MPAESKLNNPDLGWRGAVGLEGPEDPRLVGVLAEQVRDHVAVVVQLQGLPVHREQLLCRAAHVLGHEHFSEI